MEISVGGYSFPCFSFLFFERISLLCVLAEWRRYMGRFLLWSFVSRHKIPPKKFKMNFGGYFVWLALSSQMG